MRLLPALLLSVLLLPSVSHAASSALTPALVSYLDGLDAMMQGRWTVAVAAFSKSMELAGDDPSFVLARGVAETLAEHYQPALRDLLRVQRLGGKGREAELWLYAAESMSGLATSAHVMGRPPGYQDPKGFSPGIVSIPGHIVQGRDDYPTDYASCVAYELAMPYARARHAGGQSGSMEPAKQKCGRWFASRFMTRPDLAAAHLARARSLHAARQYEAALREVGYARVAYPADPDVIYLFADSWLALGRPATARKEFTIALTRRTDFAAAYLGRALAAARLGDATRAQADLEVATRLDPARTRAARPVIEAELAAHRPPASIEAALAALEASAHAHAGWDELAARAMAVHLAAAAPRLRYDETYQDRLRVLEDGIRAAPKRPGPYVELGRYLIEESDNRGEKVEPRREVIPYRWQSSKADELHRAILVLNNALQISPQHVPAMMQKAFALTGLKAYDQAEALVDQALRLAGNNPDALRLFARFRAMRANQLSAEAAGLRQERCTSSTHTEQRSDGLHEITTTTCYPPSQGELQRAAQLDAQAADLRRRARAALETALKLTKGTVEGFLIQADLQMWDGQYAAALNTLQQAVALDPRSLVAQEALVDLYAKTGQQEKAEEQQAIARQLIHTTAAPMLRQAWTRITKTAWQGAKTSLASARRLDPIDGRVPAYLGIALEEEGRADDARAAFRTAVALEDARLRLDETSPPGAQAQPRDPLDFGLAIAVRLHMAQGFEQAGRTPEALELYRANLTYELRVGSSGYSRQMFSAMFPDPHAEPGSVPSPVNASSLLAQSRMAAGRSLKAQGHQEEALHMFAAAAAFGPKPGAMIPKVGNSRGETNYAGEATGASAEAMLELAKGYMRSGDYQTAFKYAQAAGQNHPPPHLRRELNEVNMAIVQALNRRLQDDRTRDYEQQRQETIRDAQLRLQQSAQERQGRRRETPPWQDERLRGDGY